MRVCRCMCARAHLYVDLCVHACDCAIVRVRTHMHVYTCVCVRACVRACESARVRACLLASGCPFFYTFRRCNGTAPD